MDTLDTVTQVLNAIAALKISGAVTVVLTAVIAVIQAVKYFFPPKQR